MSEQDRNERVYIGDEKFMEFLGGLVSLYYDFAAVPLFDRYIPLPVNEVQAICIGSMCARP